jgi:hypothetical protein
MARISTYDRDLVLSRDDILIGSDAENSSITKNYSVGSLIDFISLSSDGVVDTNYYLSAITADQTTGIVTFVVNGIDDQELTLGTAAFSAVTDFAADDVSFNTSQVVAENDITAYYLNVQGNGTSGQLLASDGDGSFSWVDSASISDTNFFLNGVTRSGNVVTFEVNGSANQSMTFGSAAFESVTSIISQLSSGLSLTDIDTSSLKALAYLDTVSSNELQTDAVTTLKVKAEAITEEKLKTSNVGVSGYVLTSDGSDGFTWAANSASNYFLDGVSRNNEVVTFSLGGGGTDVSFTFGEAAFLDKQTSITDRNAARLALANHTHIMSHITDAGALATKTTVGTGDIDNNAITAGKLSASTGVNGQVLSLSGGNLAWTAAGAGASNFLALSDTPSSYTANAGDILKVNAAVNGLEFSSFKVSNVDNFTTVNTGTAGKVLAVDVNNQSGTNHLGLKWIDTSQVGATTFTGLSDTASSIGAAHQIAVVNAAANQVEFRTLDANMVPDDIITSGKIADDAIITALIADDAITNALIADNAVATSQINASAVTEGKISTGAVTTGKIGGLAVTEGKIAANAVALAKLKSDVTVSALPNAENTRTAWDTTGNTKIDWYVNSNNEMRLLADGTLHVDGDVIAFSTVVASDKKLKNNIQTIVDPIDKIKQLDGVTFNWARNGKQSGGIIAQDVQKVMPSLVSEVKELNDTSSHLAVDYNGVIGLLIETVKEQQNQIDELKKQLS